MVELAPSTLIHDENHMQIPALKSTPRKNYIIVAPFDQDQYLKNVFIPDKFRESLDEFINEEKGKRGSNLRLTVVSYFESKP